MSSIYFGHQNKTKALYGDLLHMHK